ncbi:MAG: SdpI family protein, partial [Oscillospiraceae bacterium]|nr:SdpI family protein [Oscillospiraceae bacterium]
EENWNKTHRLAGKVWTIGGVLQMLAAFLPQYAFAIFLTVIVVMVLIPTLYSYALYRKMR